MSNKGARKYPYLYKLKKHKGKQLSELETWNQKARDAGMTYGQYVAKMENKEKFKRNA